MSDEDNIGEERVSERVFHYPEGFLDPQLPRGVLSPSQISTYQKCARQYEYQYILGVRTPPGVSMVRGTAIHKGAEAIHNSIIKTGKPIDFKEGAECVSSCFDIESAFIENWDGKTKGVVKDSTINGYATYYRQAVPRIKPVHAEKTFAIKVGTVPIRGVIDLVDRVPDTDMSLENDPNNPRFVDIVSDLKTTTKRWPEQKIRFTSQLTFYALAEGTNRVRIDFLIENKTSTIYEQEESVRNASDIKLLIEDVEEISDLIKKGYFPRCDPTSWACTEKYCGYYAMCRGKK